MLPADHPLRIANFRAYWASRLLSTLAGTALAIVLGWQVYSIARETMAIKDAAFLLGMIGAAQFVPIFLLTPIVGLAADSIDRRLIVIVSTTLLVATAAILGLATWGGWISLPVLFAAAFTIGCIRAFSGPAYSALTPNLVPREVLPTALAVSSIAWQVGSIAGPSLGGLLYALHPDVAYGAITAMLALALGALTLIGKVPQPPAQKDHRIVARISEGFSYVRRNRLVLGAITLDLFVVLLAGATALMPIYARDFLTYGGDAFGPTRLGILAASMGAGASVSSVIFSIRPLRKGVGAKMLFAVAFFGLCILAFGTAHLFLPPLAALCVAVLALAAAGAADMVSVYVRTSLIQLHTPDEMRGRVSAVSQLTISASNELGEAESGLVASLIGPVGAIVVGGVGAIGVTLLWARIFPELRLAKTFDPPEILEIHPEHGVQP